MHHFYYQEERCQLRATVLGLSEVSDIMIISPIFASPQNGSLEKIPRPFFHLKYFSSIPGFMDPTQLHPLCFPTAWQNFKSTFPSRSFVRFLIPMRLYF